jgi:hypothetical protein
VINTIKGFLQVQKYYTIQAPIVHINQPFVGSLKQGRIQTDASDANALVKIEKS